MDIGWAGCLVELIRKLPESRAWTAEQRDRWLKAMTAHVDLLIETKAD